MFFPLSPSVCQCSHPCLPLVISPVPHLIISVCVFSLCVPFTPCPVIVFVSLCLRPCSRLFLVPHAINYDFVRRVGQKYFVSYKERGSFSRAVDFCSQQGLELALPQNEEENNMLTQVFGEVHKMAWINVNNNKAEGKFETDMKNRPLTFTKWGAGQPDRSVGDTGCTMLSEHGIWRLTQECSLNAYIVCQN
uniref:C-type lectin domain-containing protein n=1 Tax=Sparus aurata TaxID=8175 RepID=A0A671UGU4_SPAAU